MKTIISLDCPKCDTLMNWEELAESFSDDSYDALVCPSCGHTIVGYEK